MKIVLLGIAIILFGISIITAYSTTGFAHLRGTQIGLGISLLGLLISIVGCFIKLEK